jgi:hypothetical protein
MAGFVAAVSGNAAATRRDSPACSMTSPPGINRCRTPTVPLSTDTVVSWTGSTSTSKIVPRTEITAVGEVMRKGISPGRRL